MFCGGGERVVGGDDGDGAREDAKMGYGDIFGDGGGELVDLIFVIKVEE